MKNRKISPKIVVLLFLIVLTVLYFRAYNSEPTYTQHQVNQIVSALCQTKSQLIYEAGCTKGYIKCSGNIIGTIPDNCTNILSSCNITKRAYSNGTIVGASVDCTDEKGNGETIFWR